MSLALALHHDGPPLEFVAEVPAGCITALVGPSGSGKTSILRAVAGLLRVRRARIAFGDDVWDDAQHHRETRDRPIGLVPQGYALFPHLTVQSNVETALLHLDAARRRQRASECIALAHVAGLERRRPHELSGGQKQRVALARAIARDPKVLLLDEPFSAVDRSTRKRLYVELRRLHARLGNTIVLVTHDLDEAAQLASHLLLVRHGRLLQAGPTTEVLTRPRDEAAARLLDIPNVFDARADAARAGEPPLLRWGPHVLRAVASAKVPAGASLRWAVLPSNVLLVRADKPRQHLENLVDATVDEVIELGAEALAWLRPRGLPDERLQMRLPARALRTHSVRAGAEVTVCLRAADLVLLEAEGDRA
ncbi:MAG: ABC transporter ATP-binding protein [Burkholderiaceae bacterium]|nr:ABC transporter ATP-binding protein [Burkholderiaceae bacterium]